MKGCGNNGPWNIKGFKNWSNSSNILNVGTHVLNVHNTHLYNYVKLCMLLSFSKFVPLSDDDGSRLNYKNIHAHR